uniref:C2H2-type domain-containing protein n=1 Tax=Kalanchoe fedtschenkoi TaxID=63787 RepID=A0A7N0UBP7_KALFE
MEAYCELPMAFYRLQVALDMSEEEKLQLQDIGSEDSSREIFCPIVGCRARLNAAEFEDHYNARHTASCSVCSRVYPTTRLLSLHVSEAHDSFFQAKVARGYAMYECLVESCGLKFKTYKARQQHLVDKHAFPASYDFFKKARPSKKHRLKTHRKQSTIKKEEDPATRMEVEDQDMDILVSAVSKLTTSDSTPSSITFGRRGTRGLTFTPRAVQLGKKHPDSTSSKMQS